MRDKKQETTTDIIAWLRRPREGENGYLTAWRDEIADRLEAARKREVDALKQRLAALDAEIAAKDEVIKRLNDAIAEEQRRKMATTEKSSAVGNVAKLREALMEIRDICLRVGANISPTSKKYQSRECQTIFACFRKAADALAAPQRNCDVGTAEEQAARMRAFCVKNGLCRDGSYRCENCGLLHEFRCELTWAQMPYEEGGAE